MRHSGSNAAKASQFIFFRETSCQLLPFRIRTQKCIESLEYLLCFVIQTGIFIFGNRIRTPFSCRKHMAFENLDWLDHASDRHESNQDQQARKHLAIVHQQDAAAPVEQGFPPDPLFADGFRYFMAPFAPDTSIGPVDMGPTGEITFYDRPSDSGHTVSQGFCAKCGSPVMNKNAGYPDSRYFHAATLDDPSLFRPERVLFRDAAQPWDHIDPDLP